MKIHQSDEVVLKGYLLKKNPFFVKQLRLFVLHSNGELKYYDDKDGHKGTIIIGPYSNIRKSDKTEIRLFSQNKNKDY